jgi:hypothetical protein
LLPLPLRQVKLLFFAITGSELHSSVSLPRCFLLYAVASGRVSEAVLDELEVVNIGHIFRALVRQYLKEKMKEAWSIVVVSAYGFRIALAEVNILITAAYFIFCSLGYKIYDTDNKFL